MHPQPIKQCQITWENVTPYVKTNKRGACGGNDMGVHIFVMLLACVMFPHISDEVLIYYDTLNLVL